MSFSTLYKQSLKSNSQDLISSQQINQLVFAKRQLLNRRVPWNLRVKFYLRVGCFTLRQGDRLALDEMFQKYHSLSYLKLLQLLSEHDICWYYKCSISSDGTIESSDRTISELLDSINQVFKADYEFAKYSV